MCQRLKLVKNRVNQKAIKYRNFHTEILFVLKT